MMLSAYECVVIIQLLNMNARPRWTQHLRLCVGSSPPLLPGLSLI
jgi:hypothetical protein